MQRRQFSVEKLIKQLKTSAVKIGYENVSDIAVESRVFADAPKALSYLKCDVEREALEVANILTCIKPSQIVMEDFLPTLTNPKYAEQIRRWAADVIKHAAAECLTDKNHIKPALLAALPASATTNLTPHDVIISYFTALAQPMLEVVKQKLAVPDIHKQDHIEKLSLLFSTLTQNKSIDQLIEAEFQHRARARGVNTKIVFGCGAVAAGLSAVSWMLMFNQASQASSITHSPAITVKP